MSNLKYKNTSPYFQTSLYGNFLDIMVNRSITKKSDDVLYAIDKIYEHRPDLLAADLYGDGALWWVFAIRNPNVLKDPLFDFKTGLGIYLPKADLLKQLLGT